MISRELVQALLAARRRMTAETWHQMAHKLASTPATLDDIAIRHLTSGVISQDGAWLLAEALRKSVTVPCSAIAASMMTMESLANDSEPGTELIWTGPTNNRFPVRRLDQVLYDLVSKAQKRIVLVTFAAHRVRILCEHLTCAVQRGVRLTLIIESEDESEGQLTRDAVAAFKNVPASRTHIYHWPLDKRERNQAGRPGKLHMKCAIVDGVALIGSANLTDDAFNRNMELGMLVREPSTVESLSEHFRELIRGKILMPVRIK